MMTQETFTTDQNIKKSQALLQQGYVAYNNWEINKARLLWRKAAVYNPANEEIWLALYNVTQSEEDRKVCLHNIIILNPDNIEAEQRLRLIENETQPTDTAILDPQPEVTRPVISENVQRVLSGILTLIMILAVAIVLFSMLIQPLV
jgi:hypothetical protein